ncbi:hypothetical protein CUJ91_33395 (plasmid) [Paraburkholderia graminis]|nr:hypothetical protein CUJ91_33395 [Paraburkholderia graminis]
MPTAHIPDRFDRMGVGGTLTSARRLDVDQAEKILFAVVPGPNVSRAWASSVPLFQLSAEADMPRFPRTVESETACRIGDAFVLISDAIYGDFGGMMFATRARNFRIFPRIFYALADASTRG